MRRVQINISSIYYFIKIPIILKQHIQSDRITNERTDGQTDKVKPVYPPFYFVEAGV